MGFQLYREVRDFAPADLSQAELTVALMIADDANENSRRSWIPLPLLCQRTRLSPTGLRGALQRLAARGLEFRVIHGYGKDGRPVFAAKGHTVDYEVPDLLKGDAVTSPKPVDNPAKGDAVVSPNATQRRQLQHSKATRNSSKGDAVVSPLSSTNLTTNLNPVVAQQQPEVEGAKLSTGQELDHSRPSRLEVASWQAAQSRHTRMNGSA